MVERPMADDFDPGIEGLSEFRRIGSGGFSTVYAAWESAFSRWVAVKVLDELDETASRRFARERALMGQSSGHPNVITPIRFGFTTGGKPYLVMQFMEGGSLQDVVDRGERIPWRRAVGLIRPIAEALGDSHDAGILHKDVKPANILLARNGTPSLTDFGIASARDSTVTQMSFTFAHAPPETFSDEADVRDERSDLYSLASTLYTIVAGRPPFAADGNDAPLALMSRIAHQAVAPTGVDPTLDRFLSWALAKDPGQRPQSAREFVDGLDGVLAGAAPATEPPGAQPSEPTIVRSPAEHRTSSGPTVTDGRDASGRPFGAPAVAVATSAEVGWSHVGPSETRPSRRGAAILSWVVAALAVLGAGVAAWYAFGRGPGDERATDTSTPGSEQGTEASTAPFSPTTDPPPAGGDEEGGDALGGEAATRPAEVEQTILLLQPDTAVFTVVDGEVVLPSTSISDGGFSADNCESQLVGLQAAFGGAELSRLRGEIAEFPAGAPEGYDDPAGLDRGFRERLDAYADQFDAGYRSCIEVGTFTPVGPYVLGGWASIRALLCTTEVLPRMTLPDGSEQTCPAADEIELCTRMVAPLLGDFFSAFPTLAPDPGEVCRAAAADDRDLLDELSSAVAGG